MTDFVLVPGSGGIATPYWRLVSDRLQHLGHRAFPVDLPGSAPEAGLPECTRSSSPTSSMAALIR